MSQTLLYPDLPVELWIQIFMHLSAHDLWNSARQVSRLFQQCADDVFFSHFLPKINLKIWCPLDTGPTKSSLDVHFIVMLSYVEISRQNPQYALFEYVRIGPKHYAAQALEKWNRICTGGGPGPRAKWRVAIPPSPVGGGGEVQGAETKSVKLTKFVVSKKHGIWCHLKELLESFHCVEGQTK